MRAACNRAGRWPARDVVVTRAIRLATGSPYARMPVVNSRKVVKDTNKALALAEKPEGPAGRLEKSDKGSWLAATDL
jgi:hypothetical protein